MEGHVRVEKEFTFVLSEEEVARLRSICELAENQIDMLPDGSAGSERQFAQEMQTHIAALSRRPESGQL